MTGLALIICETKNTASFLDRCAHVKVAGIALDYDPLPMTQGTVTSVGSSRDGSSLDFKVHEGYDEPDYDGKGVGHIWIVDAATRQLKPGCGNHGGPQEMRESATASSGWSTSIRGATPWGRET